jgi:alpha,alpha-trehalase
MLVYGLDNLSNNRTREIAFRWAQRWVTSNYLSYNATHAMFEKYNAEHVGGHGDGGEYEVVLGFGWTNGVILDFLNKYGRELTVSGCHHYHNHRHYLYP